jgi:hypothetical protein
VNLWSTFRIVGTRIMNQWYELLQITSSIQFVDEDNAII